MPAPRLQNVSPRFHSAPRAPAAAHRQASRGPRGPRASKCVTTHFCRVSLAAPPRPHPCFRSAGGRQEPPGAPFAPRSRRGKLAFPAVLTRFQGPAPWRTPRPRARLARFPNKSREFKERAPNLSQSQLPSGHPGMRVSHRHSFFGGKAAEKPRVLLSSRGPPGAATPEPF